MIKPNIYIYRHYDNIVDCGLYEYLRIVEDVITWQWTTDIERATGFDSIREAKSWGKKYEKIFNDNNYSFAFTDSIIVTKSYYSHKILEEV